MLSIGFSLCTVAETQHTVILFLAHSCEIRHFDGKDKLLFVANKPWQTTRTWLTWLGCSTSKQSNERKSILHQKPNILNDCMINTSRKNTVHWQRKCAASYLSKEQKKSTEPDLSMNAGKETTPQLWDSEEGFIPLEHSITTSLLPHYGFNGPMIGTKVGVELFWELRSRQHVQSPNRINTVHVSFTTSNYLRSARFEIRSIIGKLGSVFKTSRPVRTIKEKRKR